MCAINGPSTLCNNSSATFSISSVINPNIVTWSATPSGKVSLSPNGDQVTVTKLDTGNITLTASIVSSCGNFLTEKQIQLGVPDRPQAFDISGDEIRRIKICTKIYNHIHISKPSYGILEWDWVKVSGNFQLLASGRNAQIIGFTPTSGLITVRARNACGWSAFNLILVFINDCWHTSNHSLVKLYPNPASNSITIAVGNQNEYSKLKGYNKKTTANITAVKIYDSEGTVRLFQKYNQKQKVLIDVSSLENGLFVVEVYTGDGVEYQKLVVQR